MRKIPNKFKKLFNLPIQKTFKDKEGNEIELEFKPLNAKQFILLTEISKYTIDKEKAIKKELGVKELDKDQLKELAMDTNIMEKYIDLCTDVMLNSYPNDLDEELAQQFAIDNLNQIMEILPELSPGQDISDNPEAMKRIKKLQNNR